MKIKYRQFKFVENPPSPRLRRANPLTRSEAADIHKEAAVHRRVAARLSARKEMEGANYYSGMAEGMRDVADQYREHFKRNPTMRPIYEIADEILRDWKNVYYAAIPYLNAMRSINTMRDRYGPGQEEARTIVLYFLSNASQWKGETARRIKAELKSMLANRNPVHRVMGLNNPHEGRTKIYERVLKIYASKAGMPHHCDAKCKAAGHQYVHTFKKKACIYGLSNGNLLVG
jgi:hypothetical protein